MESKFKTKVKKLTLLLSLFAIIALTSGNFLESTAAPKEPDYSGNWEFFFYDASGKLEGRKTLSVSDQGVISGKAIMSLDNVIYNTEVSGNIAPNGKISDGSLTDTDKLEMEGTLSGSFNETEGSGTWKNYYNKSGTWKATRAKQSKY